MRVHWVNLFEPDGFEKLKQALDSEIVKRSTNESVEGQKQFLEVQEELQYILSQYSCPYCGAPLVAKVWSRRAMESPGSSRWKPFGLACNRLSPVLFGN